MHPLAGATERLLTLNDLSERLPIFTKGIFTKGRKLDIQATDVYLLTPAALSASALVLTQATDEFNFTDGPPVGTIVKQFLDSLENRNQRIKETLKISNNFPQFSLKKCPVVFDRI
ncbi:MAG: hypothetical protein H6973_19110 [Gammaproteobacteria bacterium]|nr:hypothetical protein [Gammaproteobacteria bacterium]